MVNGTDFGSLRSRFNSRRRQSFLIWYWPAIHLCQVLAELEFYGSEYLYRREKNSLRFKDDDVMELKLSAILIC